VVGPNGAGALDPAPVGRAAAGHQRRAGGARLGGRRLGRELGRWDAGTCGPESRIFACARKSALARPGHLRKNELRPGWSTEITASCIASTDSRDWV
jgi:hypothetical protein